MQPFRHYLTTRFNIGIYQPNAKIRIPPDEWMEHRMRLFSAITLPSIMGQSCTNFTWLLGMDIQTPDRYIQEIKSFRRPNLKVLLPRNESPIWKQAFDPGQYDLLTTRIDNDDAFHRDAIAAIQQAYVEHRDRKTKPWVVILPFGAVIDVAQRQLLGMEYWYNNCPTLVDDSSDPRTIWQWDHSNIPPEVGRCFVTDKPYWLQVVHSQNVLNTIPVEHPVKIVHREAPLSLAALAAFNIAPEDLARL